MSESQENLKFVTITLSEKQIDFEHARVSEKNNKEYVRIMGPDGGVFFYPKDSLKKKENEDKYYFSRPVGTEITLIFSERVEGVAEDAPNSEKWKNTEQVVKIEDLHEMYADAKQAFKEEKQAERENSPFAYVSIPTEWGKAFLGNDGKAYISISFPVRENGESNYYTMVLPAEQFKASERVEGTSYFGLPKHKKDSEEDYMVQLTRSVKNETGEYEKIAIEMKSVEVIEHLKSVQNKIEDIEISVSEKLVHYFEHEGKELASVSVPVFDKAQDIDVFYNITLPSNRVVDAEYEGKKKVSVSPDFEFNAKRSVKDESTGEYSDIVIKMTGKEVESHFKESKSRYRETHQDESEGQSEGAQTPINHHRRGR